MPLSAKRSMYSDMPSFLSQSAICCIAATKVVVACLSFWPHDYRKITPKKVGKARLPGEQSKPAESGTGATSRGTQGKPSTTETC
jgi:hypothetical protein